MAKNRRRPPTYELDINSLVDQFWDERSISRLHYIHLIERMPRDAIPANLRLLPDQSCLSPKLWYEDQDYTCCDCGEACVWTARQQQWWHEVAKGTIYSEAKRCPKCRAIVKEKHGGTPRRSHQDRQN